jgi:DNA-binding HxlR family transcriptional regulator
VADYDVFLADCPARSALELISGTWSVVVLAALADGPHRYSELLARIGGISRKMLTQTLRRTTSAGLVTAPGRRGGEYRLTALGESLVGSLTAVCEWADDHADELVPADDDELMPAASETG